MLCRLRPAPFLRRESPRLDVPGRALVGTSIALVFAAMVGISYQVLGSWNAALLFSGGLFCGAALCFMLAKLSLRAIAVAKRLPPAMRLGIGNLTRPGNHASLLIGVIAAGTMMMVATLQSGVVTMRAVEVKLPYDLTNSVLIAGFQASHREQILSFARGLPGVESAEMKTQVGIRLTAVDGVPLMTAGSWYVAGCSEQGLTIDRSVARRTGAGKGFAVELHHGQSKDFGDDRFGGMEEEVSYPVKD